MWPLNCVYFLFLGSYGCGILQLSRQYTEKLFERLASELYIVCCSFVYESDSRAGRDLDYAGIKKLQNT